MWNIFCQILCKPVLFLFVCNFCAQAAEIFMHFPVLLKTYSASPVIILFTLTQTFILAVISTSDSPCLPYFSVRCLETDSIGVARGCTWCTCTPRAEKKIWVAKFTGECCKCTPGTARVQFSRTCLLGRGDLEGGSG